MSSMQEKMNLEGSGAAAKSSRALESQGPGYR
jgi:hypothetical protein